MVAKVKGGKTDRLSGGPDTNLPGALLQLLVNEGQVDRSTVLRRLGISPSLLDALLNDLVRRGWLAVCAEATVNTMPSLASLVPTGALSSPASAGPLSSSAPAGAPASATSGGTLAPATGAGALGRPAPAGTGARAVGPTLAVACRTCPLAARSFLVNRGEDLPAVRRYLLTPAGRRHLQAFLQALQKSPG